MTRPRALVAALATLATLTVRAGAQPAVAQPPAAPLPSVTLPPELDRVLRDCERAWQARDAAGLAALFTDDGMTLPNGRPPVRGRDAVQRGYEGSGGPLALRAIAYATSDTVGYIIGGFAMRAGAPDGGKFVLALRRARGGPWKIAADMDNMNASPRRGPAPSP